MLKDVVVCVKGLNTVQTSTRYTILKRCEQDGTGCKLVKCFHQRRRSTSLVSMENIKILPNIKFNGIKFPVYSEL